LETRLFLSAAFNEAAPLQFSSTELDVRREHAAIAHARRASTVPADLFGNYGGSYNSAASFGDVVMTVTSAKGSQFFGTLTFTELDGNTISGAYKAQMGRNYSLKLKMRSSRTAIKASGQYHPEGVRQAFIMTMGGRFDGQRLGRFGLGGAFAVMKDLGV
jgi:hypothetical protein